MRATRLIPALGIAAGLLVPTHALGATFTPTTQADGNNGACTPTLCTLRDAVVAANAASGSEIVLPAGTYAVSMGELRVNNPTTIRGSGARSTTVNASGTSRVFFAGAAGTVTFQDLTITGGAAGPTSSAPAGDGGAIVNESTEVVLRRVALVNNTATFSGGAFVSAFEGTGAQRATIEDSLVAGNRVTGGALNGQGGGLSLFGGDATITNSTITGNSVSNTGTNQGGGIVAATSAGAGGPSSLTLLNTTVAGNSISGVQPGGVVPNFGGGVAGNSLGATPVLTDLRAKNSIVAGNTVDGAVQDCGLVSSSQTSHNLSSDSSCGFTDSSSKQSTDPKLRTLTDNGGPTSTLALGGGSPAVNSGDNAGCPAADQRGTIRPQVVTCDIGAYEALPPDLVLTQAARHKVRAGRTLTYTIKIANRGEQSAVNVTLKDNLPLRVRKLKGQKAGCKISKKKWKRKRKTFKRALGCDLGALAPGESREIKVKVRPARPGKRLRNTVRVISGGPGTSGVAARTVVRVTGPAPSR